MFQWAKALIILLFVFVHIFTEQVFSAEYICTLDQRKFSDFETCVSSCTTVQDCILSDISIVGNTTTGYITWIDVSSASDSEIIFKGLNDEIKGVIELRGFTVSGTTYISSYINKITTEGNKIKFFKSLDSDTLVAELTFQDVRMSFVPGEVDWLVSVYTRNNTIYFEGNGKVLGSVSFASTKYVCPVSNGQLCDAQNKCRIYGLCAENNQLCSKDSNTDGYIDINEIQKCSPLSDNKYLCPIDLVECNAKNESPICPPNSVLDVDRDLCLTPPTSVSCPLNYVLDDNLCKKTATCLDGGILDQERDLCISSPYCPDGFILSNGRCESNTQITCPNGMVYQNGYCTAPPSCTVGVYDTASNKCTLAPTISCPSGYTHSNGVCVAQPQCLQGTYYNADLKKCVAQPTCPPGYVLNGSTGKCELPPPCTAPGIYNITTNRCESNRVTKYYCSLNGFYYDDIATCSASCYYYAACTMQGDSGYVCPDGITPCDPQGICTISGTCAPLSVCPSGYIPVIGSPTKCYQNVSCPSQGTLDTAIDKCITYPTSCPNGTSLDTSLGLCTANPFCNAPGSFNSVTGSCEVTITINCPSGYILEGEVCTAPPVCFNGNLNPTLDLCIVLPDYTCSQGIVVDNKCVLTPSCSNSYMFNTTTQLCELLPICDNGTYDAQINMCTTSPQYVCPGNTTYDSVVSQCKTEPTCSNGTYDPAKDICFVGYTSCPYEGRPCVQTQDGKYKCTPYDCYLAEMLLNPGGNSSSVDETNYINDGVVDQQGCQGVIFIFNGKAETCRPPGATTNFYNCCDDTSLEDANQPDWWRPITNILLPPYAWLYDFTMLFLTTPCQQKEIETNKKRKDRLCRYIGDVCEKELPLLGCIQKREVYCCYDSMLARIVQEQGRLQLGITWGTPEAPNCRGFTNKEFSMLDFSKMDLREYIAMIQMQAIQNTVNLKQQELQNKIKNRLQQ